MFIAYCSEEMRKSHGNSPVNCLGEGSSESFDMTFEPFLFVGCCRHSSIVASFRIFIKRKQELVSGFLGYSVVPQKSVCWIGNLCCYRYGCRYRILMRVVYLRGLLSCHLQLR